MRLDFAAKRAKKEVFFGRRDVWRFVRQVALSGRGMVLRRDFLVNGEKGVLSIERRVGFFLDTECAIQE
jgi:hypothetical protein